MRGSDFGRKTSGRSRPFVMGILNVTPDSFSDGGLYSDTEFAVRHAFEMADDGADIIDIGAESTRPGAAPVSAGEEIRRLIPVIQRISESCRIPISVDTMKPEVARAAVSAGANIVNDVNGLRAEGMAEFLAEADVPAVLMHMHGTMETTHSVLMSDPAIPQILSFFDERISAAEDAGMKRSNIILDPGIGFGKTMGQNVEILRNADSFVSEFPLLIALSRKRFLAEAYPGMAPDDATAEACVLASRKGADILRVHNVGKIMSSLQNRTAKTTTQSAIPTVP